MTALMMAISMPASAQQFGANDAPFLNFMGDMEAPAGFSDVYDAAPFGPDRPIETLTIAEVLTFQRALRQHGSVSSAVGRYQFIYETLSWLVADLNLDTNRVFDSEMQTFLARHLMYRCGFYDSEKSIASLGNCLARRWAALPILSGAERGQSVYKGIANNKALTSPERVEAILANRFSW